MAYLLFLFALRTDLPALAGSEEVTLVGIVLMQQHGPIVQLHEDDEDHHQQGEQGIEVKGDGLDEDADAVPSLDES